MVWRKFLTHLLTMPHAAGKNVAWQTKSVNIVNPLPSRVKIWSCQILELTWLCSHSAWNRHRQGSGHCAADWSATEFGMLLSFANGGAIWHEMGVYLQVIRCHVFSLHQVDRLDLVFNPQGLAGHQGDADGSRQLGAVNGDGHFEILERRQDKNAAGREPLGLTMQGRVSV